MMFAMYLRRILPLFRPAGPGLLAGLLLLAGCHSTPRPSPPRVPVAARASCSSLVKCKQPSSVALKTIGDLGFPYVDLSCLGWAPHVSVPALVKNFDAEAGRIEAELRANNLLVSNLTFDAVDSRPWEQYGPQFGAVVKLAVRLNTRLINVMAPAADANMREQERKLNAMVQAAAEQGVLVSVETHVGQITELPADAQLLCRRVPGLRLTLDPSHYYAGPNQGKSFAALLPLVQGTGFRAGGMNWESIQSPWGEGPIDFKKLIYELEAFGYSGYYVCEYLESFNNVDPVEQSRRFFAWINQLPPAPPPVPGKPVQ
jgi:sugar phosphate isomerase/epimerase